MLRIILVLAACAFAQEDLPSVAPIDTIGIEDTAQVAPAPAETHAWGDAPAAPKATPAPVIAFEKKRSQSDFLRLAGTHWLVSLGLGALGAGILHANDYEGESVDICKYIFIASAGFHLAVPIDLILASLAHK